nr:immunoglobulin heavy chain junction region [Macaca mulatta]MOW26115.1 immunoglobulin heavy chain junction region [Macaca mulatta]
CTGRKGGDDVW